VDAVRREPVSMANSLLPGKLTGILTIRGRPDRTLSEISTILRAFSDGFIDFGAGNFVAGTGNLSQRNWDFSDTNRERAKSLSKA
jgi:hypothetical protein